MHRPRALGPDHRRHGAEPTAEEPAFIGGGAVSPEAAQELRVARRHAQFFAASESNAEASEGRRLGFCRAAAKALPARLVLLAGSPR